MKTDILPENSKGNIGLSSHNLACANQRFEAFLRALCEKKQKNPRQHFRQKPQKHKEKHKSKHEDFSFFPITSLSKPEFEAFFDKIILILPFQTGQNAKIVKLTIKIGFKNTKKTLATIKRVVLLSLWQNPALEQDSPNPKGGTRCAIN